MHALHEALQEVEAQTNALYEALEKAGAYTHMLYMRHYRILCNYQAADITFICSINYTIVLLSSFLSSTNRYITVSGSFHKLGLIFSDLF